MFCNDTMVGLSKNELDGVVDEFESQECGQETLPHNNLPEYQLYYVFMVGKMSASST